MSGTDPALLTAEETLSEFACNRLTPVGVLQALAERIARLNPPPQSRVAKAPGPMPVPPGELKNYLGTAKATFVTAKEPLAIVDTPLVS
jgi:Rieske Fe-S protein